MVHLPPLVHREGNEQVHRFQPSHRCEDFIVVDVVSLHVALHQEIQLVLGHRPMLMPLRFEHPLHPNRLQPSGRLIRLPLAWIALGLAKEIGSSELTTCSSTATSACGTNPAVLRMLLMLRK
jgi:hypothetical protein